MPFTAVRAGFRLLSVCAVLGVFCLGLAPAHVIAQESAVWPGAPAVITGGGEEAVLLRADPGFEAGVVTPLANGTPVTVLDGPYPAPDGTSWYQVDVGGQVGYAPAGHLAGSTEAAAPVEQAPVAEHVPVEQAPVTEQVPAETVVTDPAAAFEIWIPVGPGFTTSDVNLRAEPDGNAAVLTTLPPGAGLEVTGEAVGGFVPVWVNGSAGWVAAEYVQAGTSGAPVADPTLATDPALTTDPTLATGAAPMPDPALTAAPAPVQDPAAATTAPAGGLLTVVDANLRAEPYPEAAVIGTVPAGAGLVPSGVAENGFTPITYNGQFGWIGNDLLASGDGSVPAAAAPDAAAAPLAGGLISWPFRGGTWEVIQGYNNGTHQNRSSFANYQYALDWAQVGGGTAGQPVYAPASGTISWIDRGSGGILIDMGNGYGVAMFHVTYDYGLSRGQSVQMGQPLGTISGPGGEGYMSTEHVDMTLWQLSGNRSHVATPFTGQFAISGVDFPDLGGVNQHMGVRVTP